MLEEAISKVQELVEAAEERAQVVRFVEMPGNPEGVFIVHGGKREWFALPPPDRRHKVFTVEDLIEAGKLGWVSDAIVWHSHDQILLVSGDGKHRMDTVRMDLVKSKPFLALKDTAGNPRRQREFLALLKQDLRGCVDEGLATSVRSIKWSNSAEGTSEIRQGRESMGQSINRELTGESALPEEVTVDLPVYENLEPPTVPAKTYAVECLLVSDANEQIFRLIPLPSELTAAVHEAQQDIRQRLTQGLPDVPVLFGVP